ncbi:hypothetical protein ACD491_19170, partial [Clostridioides difficile]|uniref:hypothetical protein n=1 Tax=Clostridioides difficile TaxID=1496 RepID=UPI00355B0E37
RVLSIVELGSLSSKIKPSSIHAHNLNLDCLPRIDKDCPSIGYIVSSFNRMSKLLSPIDFIQPL